MVSWNSDFSNKRRVFIIIKDEKCFTAKLRGNSQTKIWDDEV